MDPRQLRVSDGIANDMTPVRFVRPIGEWLEDGSDLEHTRPHRAAWRYLDDRDKELVHLAVETRILDSFLSSHVVTLPPQPGGARSRARARPRHGR